MANFETYEGRPVYTDKDGGAIYCEDEQWHPFRYFDDGELDISNAGFSKASSAYQLAKLTYT